MTDLDEVQPPQDMAAEQSVLGAMLISATAIATVTEILVADDYYRPAHAAIHDAIVGLASRGEPVDPVTVANELAHLGELAKVGGPLYLHTVSSRVPIAANAEHYAGIVRDKAVLRRLDMAGIRLRQMAHGPGEVLQVCEDARAEVDSATGNTAGMTAGDSWDEALDSTIDWLEAPQVTAPTPWADVNERTGGLTAQQMVTVAGRPGSGKSLIAKDVAWFTATQGQPVHVVTLEMSRNEYNARILAGVAEVDLTTMRNRRMTERQWRLVGEARETLRGLPLEIDDRPRQSMAQIRAAARKTRRKFNDDLGLIAIDFAQLVAPADSRIPREQQVSQISRDTKLLAKEFNCPVLLLAQLNREVANRSDHVPQVTDLRESGALEQDSDQVWLLHRPDMYEPETRMGEIDLIVGKNRNGPAPITVALAFRAHFGRIDNLAWSPSAVA